MYNNDRTGEKCPSCGGYDSVTRFEYVNDVLSHMKIKCMDCKKVWNKSITKGK